MMFNKTFIKTICITLMVTLLTFSVGRVTRVSAVATTAAIAGTAFILTGAVYISYVALTQGDIVLPAAEDLNNWLGTIGHKVSQYPSGAAAYQDIYQSISRDPLADVIDDVWTWTSDRLRSFANDFIDTRIISDIVTYGQYIDVSQVVTNGFDYPLELTAIPPVDRYGNSIQNLLSVYNGVPAVIVGINKMSAVMTNGVDLRNAVDNDGYFVQKLIDGVWTRWSGSVHVLYSGILNDTPSNFYPDIARLNYWVPSALGYDLSINTATYPILPQSDIYDTRTGELTHAEEVVPYRFNSPSWNDPDNENRPIVPWVPIPQLPVNYTPPSGYVNPQWGFNLQDLLDTLEDLAGTLMDIGAIASLINGFAGLHGDEYYISYNDGDTNFYTYYQPSNTYNYGDYSVTNYNIDVSDVDEHLPVDLNTISLYTNNSYIDTVKSSAQNGSTILRDFFVFWHDVDAEIVYVLFGCAIVTLVGAFIGKWGHS